jgi:ADP-ribosylglycohydrolase
MNKSKMKDALIGLAIGDALGVPVEFKSREWLQKQPLLDMIGYGTHHQPPGTWSDDSSLTFCTVQGLMKGYDLDDIAGQFTRWYRDGHWTAHGKVFDIGGTTYRAIERLMRGESPLYSGDFEEDSNGNGSLMRILPLAFFLKEKPIDERYSIVKEVSSITHAHIRSVICCFIYVEYAILLLKGIDKGEAYRQMQDIVNDFIDIAYAERKLFDRILLHDISSYYKAEIRGSGYVLHSLESSLWCLLNENTYKDTLLTAINLGEDTDTTGAITGGLAGILYGLDSIPSSWINALARKDAISNLAENFQNSLKD